MNKRPPFCPRSQCHAPQPQGQQCPHCHKHRPLEDRAIKPATRDGRPASCFLSRCHKAPGLPPPRPPHDHPRDRNKKAAVSLPRPAVINDTVGSPGRTGGSFASRSPCFLAPPDTGPSKMRCVLSTTLAETMFSKKKPNKPFYLILKGL